MSYIKRNLLSIAAVIGPLLLPASSQAAPIPQPEPPATSLQQEAKQLAATILAAEKRVIREVAVGVPSDTRGVRRVLSDPELITLFGPNYPNMRGSETVSTQPARLGDAELYKLYGDNYPAMRSSYVQRPGVGVPPAAADGWVAGGYLQICRSAMQAADAVPFEAKSFVAKERGCVDGFSFYAGKTGHGEEALPSKEKLRAYESRLLPAEPVL